MTILIQRFLVKNINERNENAQYMDQYSEMIEVFKNSIDEKVVFLTLGAGPISKNVRNLIKNELT
jgi:UDP-N-acetylmuramate-alanine ligase